MYYSTGLPVKNGVIVTMFLFLTAFQPVENPVEISEVENDVLDWISLEEAQAAAIDDRKKVMVFVEAEWCGICRQMEENIFPEPEIQTLIDQKYHPVTIDLDSKEKVVFNGEEMTEREFARKMNISGTPTILFIDSKGEILAHQVGYTPLDRFAALLNYVDSDLFGDISFDEYLERS